MWNTHALLRLYARACVIEIASEADRSLSFLSFLSCRDSPMLAGKPDQSFWK